MPLSEHEARHLLGRVLSAGRRVPGAEILASLEHRQTGNTRFAVNQITTSREAERARVTVTVQLGKRSASASINQLDPAALDGVVERAARLARVSPENPETMPVLGRQRYVTPRGAADAATSRFGAAGRAQAAAAAIAEARAARVAIAGFYEHSDQSRSMASSAGLWAHHRWTPCGFTCSARTSDGTGSGWAGTASNRVADLDAGALAKIAIEKAVRSARPRKLDAGHYTVVLEASAVASLIDFLANWLDARSADEGRSFFAKPGGGTRVGEKLFPETVTFRTDPTDVALNAPPFDAQGVPLAPTRWIDKGVLTGLYENDRYWAKKQGKAATGRPDGWVLDGGTASRDELIKGVDRGVLITRFWYLRDVDPQSILITGLTRDGTFLIENGAIAGPVNNFRFNHSPVTMLAKADGYGPAQVTVNEDDTPYRVPTLRTHDFNLASVSDAV